MLDDRVKAVTCIELSVRTKFTSAVYLNYSLKQQIPNSYAPLFCSGEMNLSAPGMLFWYSLVVGILLLLLFMNFCEGGRKLPPGPPGWPIVGNLFQVGKKPNESLLRLARKYGPLMTLRLGLKTTVVVSSPAMAKEIFRKNDHVFAGRTVLQAVKCFSYNKSALTFAQYGPRWRMLRRIYSEHLFSGKRLEALRHLRNEEVCRTIKLIFEDSVRGSHVNIGHVAFFTALNLLGKMIFSQNVFGPHSRASEQFKETVHIMGEAVGTPNLADVFPFLQILDPQGVSRRFTACLKRAFEIVDKFIEDRCVSNVRKSDTEKDLLDVMLDLRSDEFTLTNIRGSLSDMLMAGSETTGVTIEWALAELMSNPHTMKRAQQELEDVVGRRRKVEESDIENLPYLRAVVKEVFRMHPAAPLLLPHRAESSCEIAGFVIPKHAQVIVNAWGIGRDTSIWNDPLEFLPDRFMESDVNYKGQHFELIPFGAGRRICVGLPLADRLVHWVLASLLHSFDWVLPEGAKAEDMDMTDKFGITLHKAVPLAAIARPRLPYNLY